MVDPDVGNAQLWTNRWVDIDPSGRTVADIRDYTAVANDWVVHHTLPTTNMWRADSGFITDFTAQIERASLHGLSLEQPVPEPIAFERTGFSFDLGAYAFDPAATAFSLGGGGGSGAGFDFSGHIYGGGGALTLGLSLSIKTNLMDVVFGGLGWLFPVVLDLDGNGVRIEPRMDSRVFFNADGDAALERTAWVGAGDGMLALDNGDGQITFADEIAFANLTPEPNDSDLEALATLHDANHDHVLNAADAVWGQLRVWKDANRNGKSDAGELQTLAAWGISSISLISDHRSFSLPDGSRIEGFGSFTIGGATHSLADAALAFQTNGFTRTTNGEFVYYTSQDNATVRTYHDAKQTPAYTDPTIPGPNLTATIDQNDSHEWSEQIAGGGISGGSYSYSIEVGDGGSVSAFQRNGVAIDIGSIGSVLGSQLGNQLGNNTFTKIAAGTVLSAIGKQLGHTLQFGVPGAITEFGSGGQPALLDDIVNGALGNMNIGFTGHLAVGAVGALTSLLIGELGNALGKNGFVTGFVSTVGTSITTQIATNAVHAAAGTINPATGHVFELFDGFANGQIFTNMAGAVGAFFADALAAQVMMPKSEEGAIGGQIGSSIGGLIGSWLLPGIGTAAGTFAGRLIGTVLGDMAANDPQSGGRIEMNAAGQFYITGQWQDHGGNWQWLNEAAFYQITTAYDLVNLTGGRIDTAFSNPYLRLEQNDRTFWLTRAENTSVAHVSEVDDPRDLFPLVDPGAMELVSKIDLIGGDVLTRRAFENSHAARWPKPAVRRRIRQRHQWGVASKTQRGAAGMMSPLRRATA